MGLIISEIIDIDDVVFTDEEILIGSLALFDINDLKKKKLFSAIKPYLSKREYISFLLSRKFRTKVQTRLMGER